MYYTSIDVRIGAIVVPQAGRFLLSNEIKKSYKVMNIILHKKNIAFLMLLLGAMVTLVGCNTGDTDGTVVSKTDTNLNTTTEVVEEANTTTSVEVAVNTNEAATSEVVSEETETVEETTSEEESDIPEGWVKYENEEYGFSFYHPREYSVKENKDGEYFIDMSNSDYEFLLFVDLEDKYTAQNSFRACPYSTSTENYSTIQCEILSSSNGDNYEFRVDYPLEFGGWVLSSLFKKDINYQFTLSYFDSSRDLEIREQDFYKMFTQVSNTFNYSN